MKKIKNKILIPTIIALSSATIVTSVCSTSISNSTNGNEATAVKNSDLTVPTYINITYNTDDNVTLKGVTKAKVRSGRVFGSAQKPTATHSSGLTFLGWSTAKSDIATIISDETEITTDLSVYPVFRYNAIFNPKGGTFSDGTTANKTIGVDDTNKVKKPANPTKAGYTFDGWYTTEACTTGTEFDFTTKVTSVVTLYAKWTSATYSVVLLSGSGTFTTSAGTSTRIDCSDVASGTTIAQLLTAKGITVNSIQSGLSYQGNWTSTGSDTLPASSTTITSDMIIYPKFESVSGFAPTLSAYPSAVGIKAIEDCMFYLYTYTSSYGTFVPDLQYSTDGGNTWNAAPTSPSTAITISSGSNLYLKGDNSAKFSVSTSNYSKINIIGKYNLNGSVMGLLDNGLGTATTIPYNYCFYRLFNNNLGFNGVVNVSSTFLPATTLKNYCYREMFKDCVYLETAPNLSATTLGTYCYESMFYNCASLKTTPNVSLPALTDYCCQNMFYNCISLTTLDNITVTATSAATYCFYGMFYNCAGLTSAGHMDLSVLTSLSTYCCYQMFYGCTSLTVPPTLTTSVATQKYCFCKMFYNCSSLKVNNTGTTGTAFLTTPNSTLATNAVADMLTNTGGTCKTVVKNKTYYYE